MSVPFWQPGKLYQPGALVQAVGAGAIAQEAPTNAGFESGDTSWTDKAVNFTIGAGTAFEGSNRLRFAAELVTVTTRYCRNDDRKPVFGGQIVSGSAKVQTGANSTAFVGITWYDDVNAIIRTDLGAGLTGASSNWREIRFSKVAPFNAATCSITVAGIGTSDMLFDSLEWDYFTQGEVTGLNFEATQAAAGFTGTSEPTWPTVAGNTVVDGDVTWTAREANLVVWEAKPILFSGASQPSFPSEEGAVVIDNNILWEADAGRVEDPNCPNTKQVAILASKIFAGDDDIVAYSATVNPLDWSSQDDAGYIPFGLNTYGAEPVSALGIYRSNLVIWNPQAFQMWQVDEDPQNFAILDAIPVGNRFYKSNSPVSNDLVWLTDEGIRSMGIAGASTNLQAGFFGKQIDPLIAAEISAIADEDDIISFFYPGQGQYWLVFEDTAYVLTMNGGKSDMSWSRYTFPSNIDDFTLRDGDLYLRSGDKIWLFDETAVQDDVGGTPSNFEGRLWWHYLDFGALGVTKSMIGFDVVADGTFNVAIGYDQSNTAIATTDYELTGDTLPNSIIPLPVTAPSFQFRLTWAGGEAWEWRASALYLQDWRVTS